MTKLNKKIDNFDVRIRKSDGIVFYFINTDIVSKIKFKYEWKKQKGFDYPL